MFNTDLANSEAKLTWLCNVILENTFGKQLLVAARMLRVSTLVTRFGEAETGAVAIYLSHLGFPHCV